MSRYSTPKRYEHADWKDVPPKVKDYFKSHAYQDKGLYIFGKVGTGKTHILYAIKKKVRDGGGTMLIWNVANLLYEIKQDFSRDDKRDPIDDLCGESAKIFPRIYALDDIGAEKPSDFVIETLYRIINDFYVDKRPIILTSNYSLGELAERIGERTASRIAEMCSIVELGGDDRRMRN